MTSVIQGMSMSEVRSCLYKIRSSWDSQTPWEPFNPSQMVNDDDSVAGDNNMSLTRFTWLFVLGHHSNRKRYNASDGGGGKTKSDF